jgi:hypothetical protein
MDNLEDNDKDVLGPIVSDIEYDSAGHIEKKVRTSYRLPNSYANIRLADEAPMAMQATTTHDILDIRGDVSWI